MRLNEDSLQQSIAALNARLAESVVVEESLRVHERHAEENRLKLDRLKVISHRNFSRQKSATNSNVWNKE